MTTFTKRYVRSFEELATIPLAERYKYYLDRKLLAQKTTFKNTDEPLVHQSEVEAAGIKCMPFWRDEDQGDELDSEGRAFQRYLKEHPDFGVSVRQNVLPKLVAVQKQLPAHIRLVIKAALRPVSVQRDVFQEELQNVKDQHPDWDEQQTYTYTLEFVTDPDAFLPPHASGGTLDVHLWDEAKQTYVDMGSPVNAVDDLSWSANTTGLTEQQIANRTLLRETMLAAGFAPLAAEWWHYSYGDQRWAVYYDKDPLYNAVP